MFSNIQEGFSSLLLTYTDVSHTCYFTLTHSLLNMTQLLVPKSPYAWKKLGMKLLIRTDTFKAKYKTSEMLIWSCFTGVNIAYTLSHWFRRLCNIPFHQLASSCIRFVGMQLIHRKDKTFSVSLLISNDA